LKTPWALRKQSALEERKLKLASYPTITWATGAAANYYGVRHPRTRTIWVGGTSSGDISVISTETNAHIANIDLNYYHSHPPGFEKKVLGWRFGPATRQG